MNYSAIYDAIIARAKGRTLHCYTEKHHILPRCMGGSNDPVNIVNLTPEEHFVCHQLLAKSNPTHFGLNASALALCAHPNGKRASNKAYGWLKRRYHEFMTGPDNPQRRNPRKGVAHHYFGKKLPPDFISEAGKKSISEKNSGRGNGMYGVKPWNHPRATAETRSVWAIADECIKWLETTTTRKNMYQMCKALGHMTLNPQPHRFGAVMEYLEKGWLPYHDDEWLKLKG